HGASAFRSTLCAGWPPIDSQPLAEAKASAASTNRRSSMPRNSSRQSMPIHASFSSRTSRTAWHTRTARSSMVDGLVMTTSVADGDLVPIAAFALGDRLELGPADRRFMARPEIEDLLDTHARAGQAPVDGKGVARQSAFAVAGYAARARQSDDEAEGHGRSLAGDDLPFARDLGEGPD